MDAAIRYRLIKSVLASNQEVTCQYLPVGISLSSTLNHNIRCSSPWCAPAYTVPDTCFKSGPAVVVNLADKAFSGNREFRREPTVRAGAASASLLLFCSPSLGISIAKSAMIWSATFRLSEERKGASGLICRGISLCHFL